MHDFYAVTCEKLVNVNKYIVTDRALISTPRPPPNILGTLTSRFATETGI